MATEETELTFIRCPGCRSLVPAAATRCRMCGCELDSSGEAADQGGDEEPKKSRVRQQTASVDLNRLQHAREAAPADDAPAASEVSQPEPVQPDHAYRISPEPQDESPRAAAEESFFDEEPEVSSDEVIAGIISRVDDGPVIAEEDEYSAPSSEARTPRSKEVQSEATARQQSVDERAPSPQSGPDHDDSDGEEHAPRKRKRRRRKKTSAQKNRESQQEMGGMPSATTEAPEKSVAPPAAKPSEPVKEPPVSEAAPTVKEELKEQGTERPKQDKPKVKGAGSMSEKQAKRTKVSAGGGHIGWLLLRAADGSTESFNLTAGKYFISGEQLRESDLVIADESVSVPHCMVSAEHGVVRVQDLMSESGTAVRAQSGKGYAPVEEVVALNHGDWLRIGEVELLLVLIPEEFFEG